MAPVANPPGYRPVPLLHKPVSVLDLGDGLDATDLRHVLPEIALDAGLKRLSARWTPDAGAVKPDPHDALGRDVHELQVAAVASQFALDQEI